MKNVFSGVFLDIFIPQILMIQDQQTQNNNQNRLNLLKKKQQEFYKAEFCHICENELYDDDSTGKNAQSQRPLSLYWKVSWCSI